MLTNFLKNQSKSALVAAFLILSPSAFAQHGGVNGPVTTGPLNPASGAVNVRLDALKIILSKCTHQMNNDIIKPFFPNEPFQTYFVWNMINFSKSNSALAQTLKKTYPTADSIMAEITDPELKDYQTPITILPTLSLYVFKVNEQNQAANIRAVGATTLTPSSYPTISFNSFTSPVFDPITHAHLEDAVMANNLKKSWLGEKPTDPTQISITNSDDHSFTNFYLNGDQFFKCVESAL